VQDLEKVQAALAGAALEIGKQVVADYGAIAVAPLVPGSRVIGTDVRCRLQPRLPHLVFLGVESVQVCGEDATEFSLGDIDAEVAQTL